MSTAHDSVGDRLALLDATLTPSQLAVGLGVMVALGFALLFVQDPLVHDALHNFRHGAGITCH
jgi:hypothetical protein